MKKNLLFLLLVFLFIPTVNAKYCTLERQVQINNAAGLVTAKAYPYSYEYTGTDTETGEEGVGTAYVGMIDVYNLTSDIYAVLEYNNSKYRLNYDEENEDAASYSTGTMSKVKEYKISIYAVDSECGKDAIRTLNVTVPRINRYYNESACSDYPDYFYCQEFMTTDDISYTDFTSGVAEYAKTHKSVNDETRKEGFLDETTTFLKEHWLIFTIVLVIITATITVLIYMRNKKRKEQIV